MKAPYKLDLSLKFYQITLTIGGESMESIDSDTDHEILTYAQSNEVDLIRIIFKNV